eukprot:761356-Hanusia_phi.AAC.7
MFSTVMGAEAAFLEVGYSFAVEGHYSILSRKQTPPSEYFLSGDAISVPLPPASPAAPSLAFPLTSRSSSSSPSSSSPSSSLPNLGSISRRTLQSRSSLLSLFHSPRPSQKLEKSCHVEERLLGTAAV